MIRAPKGRDQTEATQQIVQHFNDIAQHPDLPVTSEIWALSQKNTEQISQILESEQYHRENIRSHIGALQANIEISKVNIESVKALSSEVKAFSNEVKKLSSIIKDLKNN